MNYADKTKIANMLSIARSLGITQQSISDATGISQSQVSRVLSGNGKLESKAHKEICKYINSRVIKVSPEQVKENQKLIKALTKVWDGTDQQASMIADIIYSLEGLCLLQNNR